MASLDIENYRLTVAQAALCARLLAEVPLDEMLAAIERAETTGPILDPTLWREKGRAMREDKALLEAARPLWKAGRKFREALMVAPAEARPS